MRLIDRQGAIEYCESLIKAEGDLIGEYGQERINQTEVIMHYLETVPTPRWWIPVWESLPKVGQEVIFSTRTGRVHSGIYMDNDSLNRWYSYVDKLRAYNSVVTAWMPMPELYKEDEE